MFGEILHITILNNRIFDYLICFFVFLISILFINLFVKIILLRLKNWAKKTSTALDDLLIRVFQRSALPLLYFGAFYISISNLNLTPSLSKIIGILGLKMVLN